MRWILLLMVIPLVSAAGAWKSWHEKQPSQPGIRSLLFLVAFFAASVAVVEWIVFSLYTFRIGGWGANMGGAVLWFRVGFWTSIAALVLCLAGRGASRAWSMTSALLQAGLWMVMINGR